MFTGIVEETGQVLAAEENTDGLRLRVATSFSDLGRGDSVSVDGVCLTVEDHGTRSAPAHTPDRDAAHTPDRNAARNTDRDAARNTDRDAARNTDRDAARNTDRDVSRDRWFSVFLAAETRDRTYLGALAPGDAVNLERAMPADGRFDGHVVQGHVDGTAEVLAIEDVGEDWRVRFSLPADLAPYLVEKGSIAVDGISLTVADLTEDAFTVAIVPETYRTTTLAAASVGDPVHLEADVLAKYVERHVEAKDRDD